MGTDTKKQLRVGMIGYKFMGRAHSNAYRNLSFYFDTKYEPIQQVICGRNEEEIKRVSLKFGWKEWETDWRKVIEREDIDVIDIATPNYLHAEIAIAAINAGKHVICEKPLAMNVEEAKSMLEVIKETGKKALLCHNFRYVPAVVHAKKLIEQGFIGNIYSIRSVYLQDWGMEEGGDFSRGWRVDKKLAGSGVLGDTASHIIDLARFLIGNEIKEVVGIMDTFKKQRSIDKEYQVEDSALFLAKFNNGVSASFEANRFATGNKNANCFEINGEKGTIRWNLESLNELQVYSKEGRLDTHGFRNIHCTNEVHPYGGAYWSEGLGIGYGESFLHLFESFFNEIDRYENNYPDFEDGLNIQMVLEAVERSVKEHSWVQVN